MSTGPENLLCRDEDRVRVLTLHRPDRLNAFDGALYGAVADALDAAAADDSVHVVVLTGAGRAFSAGADRSLAGPAAGMGTEFRRFLAALAIPKPLLAAVNGLAVGIGVTLLPHCDLVLVDPAARLRVPFTELGVAPEAASSFLLPRMLGPQAAARMLYTSDWVSADEAVAIGLALRVTEPGAVLTETLALAGHIAQYPLASLQATRKTLLAARADAVQRAYDAENAEWATLHLPPYERASAPGRT